MLDTSVAERAIMFGIFVGIPLLLAIGCIIVEAYREKKRKAELWHRMWDQRNKELERMQAEANRIRSRRK